MSMLCRAYWSGRGPHRALSAPATAQKFLYRVGDMHGLLRGQRRQEEQEQVVRDVLQLGEILRQEARAALSSLVGDERRAQGEVHRCHRVEALRHVVSQHVHLLHRGAAAVAAERAVREQGEVEADARHVLVVHHEVLALALAPGRTGTCTRTGSARCTPHPR